MCECPIYDRLIVEASLERLWREVSEIFEGAEHG